MSAITWESVGGDESIVATPATTTLALKGVTAGNSISLSATSSAITINRNQFQNVSSVCLISTNDTSIPIGSTVTLSFTTEILDPSGMHSTVTNPERINILEAGLYLINTYGSWTSGSPTTGILYVVPQYWDFSASQFVDIARTSHKGVNTRILRFSSSAVAYLDVGDYVICSATNDSGIIKNIRNGTCLNVCKLGDA